jgi:hypothetical protein
MYTPWYMVCVYIWYQEEKDSINISAIRTDLQGLLFLVGSLSVSVLGPEGKKNHRPQSILDFSLGMSKRSLDQT